MNKKFSKQILDLKQENTFRRIRRINTHAAMKVETCLQSTLLKIPEALWAFDEN